MNDLKKIPEESKNNGNGLIPDELLVSVLKR